MIDRIERGGSILVETPSTSLMATRIIHLEISTIERKKKSRKNNDLSPFYSPYKYTFLFSNEIEKKNFKMETDEKVFVP